MPAPRFSLAIRGGLIYDGTGSPPLKADIGVTGDTIALVRDSSSADIDAETVIDARGLSVSPGFIDTHGHSEFTLFAQPEAEGKLLQGITTEISGNCGMSAGPLLGEARKRREPDHEEYAIPERWETLGEYLGLLEQKGPSINYATLCGHGNIRASVMGYEDRPPTANESDRMAALMEQAMHEGAIGLSTGLIYPPGVYSDTSEIAAIASAGLKAAPGPFIYATHMRSEGEGLMESIEESIEVGRLSGASVHISHIKTAGRSNWHKAGPAIELIERARGEGIALTCDRYPYIAAATDLDAVLPAWMYEGGNEEELMRLSDPKVIGRLRELSRSWPDPMGAISISDVSTEPNKWAEGLSIPDIAKRWGIEPFDAIVRLLKEERLRVGAIFHSMSEENMERFLSLPYAMVGSDSSVRSTHGVTRRGRPHPRGFGSMPRFLRMSIERSPDGISEAIAKITSLPARTFGLSERGHIREGMSADIVVFDPGRIRDRADFNEPFNLPDGVEHVLVNGEHAVECGRPTGLRPGRVLRGGRDR